MVQRERGTEKKANSFDLPRPPILARKNYEFWAIKMKTRFQVEHLLDLVENGLVEPSNQESY